MTRLSLIAIGGAAALAGCSQQTANSMGNDFQRTENSISDSANAIRSDTANAAAAAQQALDNQTAAFSNTLDETGNRVEAAGNALRGDDDGNRSDGR